MPLEERGLVSPWVHPRCAVRMRGPGLADLVDINNRPPLGGGTPRMRATKRVHASPAWRGTSRHAE